ncbi:hypothetical protein VA7868_00441 [Vibrio aerogenes CECT 7868]|uniref:Uncharacterized protein n=2 Tax=Vibrio aerogenes TaxID=92172 RepID=A0A1M5VM37_9VIBR|nr:hypothetical protein VA7868_00441 [Vibrio aerogenes CECT 7868]
MTAGPTQPTNEPTNHAADRGEHPQERSEQTTRTDSHEESGRYTPRNASRVSGMKLPEVDFEAFQSSLYEQINTLHQQLIEMRATQEAHLSELMTLQSEQRDALNSMFGPAAQSAENHQTGEPDTEQNDG